MARSWVVDYLGPVFPVGLQPFRGDMSIAVTPPAVIIHANDEQEGSLGLFQWNQTLAVGFLQWIIPNIHEI